MNACRDIGGRECAVHGCASVAEGPCAVRYAAELADLRDVVSTLVYWHDQDSGHIDESWWDAARELVARGQRR